MNEGNTVPSVHLLHAALRAGQLIDKDGERIVDVRLSYAHLPSGGLFGPEDLLEGEQLLIRAGLLQLRDDLLIPSAGLSDLFSLDNDEAIRLLTRNILNTSRPLWMSTAIGDSSVASELIPDAEWESLGSLVSPEEREAFLLSLGRTVDTAVFEERGEVGELAVVAACKAGLEMAGLFELAEKVIRVSTISDDLGYDVVTPTVKGTIRRLEVKATTSGPAVFTIHLSRNEAERGMADDEWRLVICRIAGDECTVVGWCSGSDFSSLLPADIDTRGRWERARLHIDASRLKVGVPIAEEA